MKDESIEYAAFISVAQTGNMLPGGQNQIIQYQDRVISYGGECREEKRKKTQFVAPIEPIMMSSLVFIGIDSAMIAANNPIPYDEALKNMVRLIQEYTNKGIYLVGWNVLELIRATIGPQIENKLGLKLEFDESRIIDVKRLCSLSLKIDDLGSYTMDSVLCHYRGFNPDKILEERKNQFGVNFCDQQNTKLQIIIESWMEEHNFTTLAEVVKWLNEPHVVDRFTFGKYCGYKIADVYKADVSYLSWIVQNKNLRAADPSLIYTCRKMLNSIE